MDQTPQFVHDFVALDRARLTRADTETRALQFDARQAMKQYVEGLWEDVTRAGEQPEIGEKYHALAVVRELVRELTNVAFDAVYDARKLPPEPEPGPHG